MGTKTIVRAHFQNGFLCAHRTLVLQFSLKHEKKKTPTDILVIKGMPQKKQWCSQEKPIQNCVCTIAFLHPHPQYLPVLKVPTKQSTALKKYGLN